MASFGVPPMKVTIAGRGRHGKTADPGRFGDRAVADIRVGIFLGETGEVQRLDHPGRAGEPAVAQPADADAEIGAIARHDGDDRAAFDAVGGIGHALAGCHHRVEDAERIVAQELDHFARQCRWSLATLAIEGARAVV